MHARYSGILLIKKAGVDGVREATPAAACVDHGQRGQPPEILPQKLSAAALRLPTVFSAASLVKPNAGNHSKFYRTFLPPGRPHSVALIDQINALFSVAQNATPGLFSAGLVTFMPKRGAPLKGGPKKALYNNNPLLTFA